MITRLSSQRVKKLRENPKCITADELNYLLNLRHEVQNLKTQLGLVERSANIAATLYTSENARNNQYQGKVEQAQGETEALKGQISLLGKKLDSERQLIPKNARKTLKPIDKPKKPQRTTLGAYTASAPQPEDC
ncbi:hypothetical protein NLN92_18890 [Citrobacter portucalensis]|uniref:hypothetical protein n=1 Tax=Citrobacter portucalensis TaxID=1639133 RepID=UPI00226B2B9A|nr:hypothetical protein [Citrobacter portucalensis]MCX8980073.1 hypothetical protein [Citrobacter portucalensis]